MHAHRYSLRPTLAAALTLAGALCAPWTAHAQTFTRITTAGNPIVQDPASPANSFTGASWIDYNGDGRIDLFVNRRALYRNDGGGNFTRLPLAIVGQGNSLGNTWGDVDNDGDTDLFTNGWDAGAASFLFLNNGDETFTRLSAGALLGDSLVNQGLGAAFGDYDSDGFIDLAVVNVSPTVNRNHLWRNLGNRTFESITTTDLTSGLAPYTMPTWSDFDFDGDADLFVGAGPADGTTAPDRIYRNTLRESGLVPLERITTGVLATDNHDGQVWNWIDYDNDGDLDVYVTNYGGATVQSGVPNDLYRNDGAGAFTRQTGMSIVTDINHSLASVWQDFDNDADLDCLVGHDGSEQARYYRNNGDGTFTTVALAPLTTSAGPHYGIAAGDYDDDGDVDLFATGVTTNTKMLLRNDSPAGQWVQFRLTGTVSNRSAIGARVRVKATIQGQPVWQMRELSAQNSWAGQHSPFPHFGLGDATVADSVTIEWPSGNVQHLVNLTANTRYDVVEEANPTAIEYSLLQAEAGPNGIELAWLLADADARPTLYRREASQSWAAIARLSGAGTFAYRDAEVAPGHRYGYRLGLMDAGVERFMGEVWVDVPEHTLALLGAQPNPAHRRLSIAFALPGPGTARLDLMDVAGRRLGSREVGSLGAGRHVVNLDEGRTLPAGVYLVRLTREGRSLTTRVAVLD